jgi:hypothetical protein
MSTDFVLDGTVMLTSGVNERRAQVQRAEEEQAALRRRELDSQCNQASDPQERIQIWERLHALRLPVAATHPLIAVIAKQTHLSVREIHDEQQRRRGSSGLNHSATT